MSDKGVEEESEGVVEVEQEPSRLETSSSPLALSLSRLDTDSDLSASQLSDEAIERRIQELALRTGGTLASKGAEIGAYFHSAETPGAVEGDYVGYEGPDGTLALSGTIGLSDSLGGVGASDLGELEESAIQPGGDVRDGAEAVDTGAEREGGEGGHGEEEEIEGSGHGAHGAVEAPGAPNEPPSQVRLNGPHAVCIAKMHGYGSVFIVADCWGNRLGIVGLDGKWLAQIGCGAEGHSDDRIAAAAFNGPHGLCVGPTGCVFIADAYNQCVRRVSKLRVEEGEGGVGIVMGEVDTAAGSGDKGMVDGPVRVAKFCYPHDITASLDASLPVLFACDFDNNCIRRIFMHDGECETVTTFAGSQLGASGHKDGRSSEALFNHPGGIALSSGGEALFVADTYNQCIRMLYRDEQSVWQVSTIAGSPGEKGFTDGFGDAARFNDPTGIALTDQDDVIVADFSNSAVRQLHFNSTTSRWQVTTLVGRKGEMDKTGLIKGVGGFQDGPVKEALINRPHGVCFDHREDRIVIADCFNNRLRILSDGVVTTLI